MSQKTIKVQLASISSCRAHWFITFTEFDKCINVDLSGNTANVTRHHLADILDTIEYPSKEGCPGIDELESSIRRPAHHTQRQGFCRCAMKV